MEYWGIGVLELYVIRALFDIHLPDLRMPLWSSTVRTWFSTAGCWIQSATVQAKSAAVTNV